MSVIYKHSRNEALTGTNVSRTWHSDSEVHIRKLRREYWRDLTLAITRTGRTMDTMEKTSSGAEDATAETQDETGYYGSNRTLKLAKLKELIATSYPSLEGVERDQIVQLIVDEDEDNQIYVKTDIWRNVEKQMDGLIGEISKGASGESKHSFLSLSNWLHKTMRVTSRENNKAYVEAQKQKAENWHNHQQGMINDLKVKAQGSKDRAAREIGEKKKLQKNFEAEQLINMQLEATQKLQGESLGEARQSIKQLTEKKNRAVEKLETYQQHGSKFVDIHGKESVVQDGANKADLETMRSQMVTEVSNIMNGKIEERFASFSASTEARLGKSFDDVYKEIKSGVDLNANRLAEFLSQMQSNTDRLMLRLEESMGADAYDQQKWDRERTAQGLVLSSGKMVNNR